MGRLEQTIIINALPLRVWRIIEKHLEHPEVSLESQRGEIQATRGEPLSEQRTGVGTRTRWFYTYKGRPIVWEDVVTEWEPQKKISWKTTSRWDMRDSFTLHPQEDGTRLVYETTYRLPYGPAGLLYGRIVLAPRMRRHLNGVLQGIKKLCENPLSGGDHENRGVVSGSNQSSSS